MGSGASISPRTSSSLSSLITANVDSIVAKVAQEKAAKKYISAPTLVDSQYSDGSKLQLNSRLEFPTSQKWGKSLKSAKSLRGLAFKHHSRQENKYIPQETVISMSRSLSKKVLSSVNIITKPKAVGSAGSFSSAKDKSSNSLKKSSTGSSGSNNSFSDAIADLKITSGVAEVPIRTKPCLKISIQDDIDWIQVSDDEGEEEDHGGPGVRREMLTLHPSLQQSYLFTQSGTIFIDGFDQGGIRVDGIAVSSNCRGSKLEMRDRLPVLCRLGSGASSVVYKAMDLRDMRLVALKMVSVFERSKRRQMVRELSTLFDLLRQKKVHPLRGRLLAPPVGFTPLASPGPGKPALGHESTGLGDGGSGSGGGGGPDISKGHDSARNRSRAESESGSVSSPETELEAVGGEFQGVSGVLGAMGLQGEEGGGPEHKYPHEFIVDFYDAFSNIEEGGVALMMEFMDGGSLQDIADGGGCDDEGTLASIALQALTGLSFLHSCSQLHRDLKPANFLLSNRGEVKVGDFGILRNMGPGEDAATGGGPGIGTGQGFGAQSAVVTPSGAAQALQASFNAALVSSSSAPSSSSHLLTTIASGSSSSSGSGNGNGAAAADGAKEWLTALPQSTSNPAISLTPSSMHRAKTFVGTATYMAPERIDGREYGYPSDVWAFGLSLMTVALGRLPIDTAGGYWTILHSIRDSQPPTLPAEDSRFSEDFRDFLACCMRHRPEDRPTCAQLLQHRFLRRAVMEKEDVFGAELERRNAAELQSIVSVLFTHFQRVATDMRRREREQQQRGQQPVTGSGHSSGSSGDWADTPGGAAGSSSSSSTAMYPQGSEEKADFDYFFGDLQFFDPSLVLRNVMLGCYNRDNSLFATKYSAAELHKRALSEVEREVARERLAPLAHQLHLGVDTVIDTIVKACAELGEPLVRDALLETPKAAHDRRLR